MRLDYLGSRIRLILREQSIHQTHELASGQDEGAFVLILGDFVILAEVVGLILQVEQTELIGTQDEIVA